MDKTKGRRITKKKHNQQHEMKLSSNEFLEGPFSFLFFFNTFSFNAF